VPVSVTGVTLNMNATTLAVGWTEQLTATVQPFNAANQSVTWESNNVNVATVNAYGLVTGIGKGTATIAVKTVDGGKTATCTVTVFGGGGTENSPCLIGTAEEFAIFAALINDTDTHELWAKKYYKLTANINLGGRGWTPIGSYNHPFSGNFDGGGFTVTGFNINGSDNAGLFGYVYSGTVSNVGVVGVSITGSYRVGGVVGWVDGKGSVNNCYTTGNVNGDAYIGGLVGDVSNGSSITNCYSTGAVSGNQYVGGITGYVGSGSVTYCYATGAISGGFANDYFYFSNVGGIVGGVGNGSAISNCAALNASIRNVDGGDSPNFGRIVGSGGTLNYNVAWNNMQAINTTLVTGQNNSTGLNGADITKDQAKTALFWTTSTNNWIGWSTTVWDITNGRLPILKSGGSSQTNNNPPSHLR